MKDNIIYENEYYESIGLCGFYYKLFEEEEVGGVVGVWEVLEGYPYLKHIIQLWPGDWAK